MYHTAPAGRASVQACAAGNVKRTRVVLVMLFAVVVVRDVARTATPAQAQTGSRPRGGGRGERSESRDGSPPAPQPAHESPSPGSYAFDFEEVLTAVSRGEGRAALTDFEKIAAQARAQGDRVLAARADFAASVAAVRLGLFQKALLGGRRAIDTFRALEESRRLIAADAERCTSTYVQVGLAYRLVGDLAQAAAVLEEGLAFAERHAWHGRGNNAIGYITNALSVVNFAQGDYRRAAERATEGAQFFEGLVARFSPQAPEMRRAMLRRHAALALNALGRAQTALGQADAADAAFARGLRYARLSLVREVEAEILLSQGQLALSRRDWRAAVARHHESLAVAAEIKRASALMFIHQGLARAFAGLGQTDAAVAAAREAVRQVEELRGELGEPGLRSGFLEDKQGIYHDAVRFALEAQHPDEAFAFAERSRARAFLDLLGNQTTVSKGRTRGLVDEEVRLRSRLAEAQASAQEIGVGGEVDAGRARLVAAERDYRAFLDRVRKESVEQASLMTVEPVTLSEIQALVPAGTTLLEYLVAEREVVVWVVERDRSTVVRIAGGRPSLIALVGQFRAAIASQAPLEEVERQASALYQRLLGPAQSEIRGDRLLVVPHGVLHYVPFVALRTPAGRWVVEDFVVSTLPSASVLKYLIDKGADASHGTLAVGNPDVGAGLVLRWAEREARLVGQRDAGATVLVRSDATELQVKKLAETAGLVHFATHGELNESDPLSSALLLVPGGGEDGRLEVRELFGLDLHARLVVLSACETGLGKLSSGDELVGLQRAFLYAGTPAVVTTLWSVDDRASYELMRAFYNRLGDAGPAAALRQAQLETRRAFPHPFAWAGFGLTGIPR